MKGRKNRFLVHSLGTVVMILALMAVFLTGAPVAYAYDGCGGCGEQTVVEQWDDSGGGSWTLGTVTYPEGGIIPYRMYFKNQEGWNHYWSDENYEINYQFQPSSGRYFFDYLTTYPAAYNAALGVAGAGEAVTGVVDDTAAIPDSPEGLETGQVLQGYNFDFDGNAWKVGSWTASDSWRAIEFEGYPTSDNAWIAWGAHLATDDDWGIGNGASSYWPSAKHLDVNSVEYDWRERRSVKAIGSLPAKCSAPVPSESEWTFDVDGVLYSDFTGTVLIINVNSAGDTYYTAFDLPYTTTFLATDSVYFSYQSPLVGNAGPYSGLQRFVWYHTTATSPASNSQSDTFTAGTTDGSVTGYYDTEYLLTLHVNPAVPGGVAGNISGGTDNTWYPEGTPLTLSANTPVPDGAGKQWRFNNWSGDASGTTTSVGVTMDQPRDITANYVAQYLLTLHINPGTVPGGVAGNISGGTSGTYYDEGTVLNLSANTPVADGAGKQWRFDDWTGNVASPPNTDNPVSVTMDQSRDITANYVAQYYLTLVTNPSGVTTILTGEGWYDANTSATATTSNQYADEFAGSRYRFDGWTTCDMGELDTPGSLSTNVYMDTWKTVTANYVTQYLLTLHIDPGTVPGGVPGNISGGTDNTWYDAGTVLSLSANTPVADGPGKQWRFLNWTSMPPDTDNPISVTMNSPKDITAHYLAQYYLTMTTNVGTVTPGDGWWDSGTVVPIGADAGSPDYIWGGWTGAGTISVTGGNPSGDSVTMNSPVSQDAYWEYSPPPGASEVTGNIQPVIMVDTIGNIQAHPVNSAGALLSDVVQTSPDGSLTITIPAGTIVLSPKNTPQYENYTPFYHTISPDVDVELAGTPAAPAGATIVRAYQIGPSGVTFIGNDATITANYDPGTAPQDKTLVWAFYDEQAQNWVDLETGGVVAGGPGQPDSLSCRTSHLTYFAILAK